MIVNSQLVGIQADFFYCTKITFNRLIKQRVYFSTSINHS